ncbi:hypothetical protein [Desulfobacter sp.]|uniref:hypothetical protein n=1 Tax=Desulfobacter sp. TaxID=2294 RepID=UPI0025804471|nr:hypothetical protein [Desulfobacter sp.]
MPGIQPNGAQLTTRSTPDFMNSMPLPNVIMASPLKSMDRYLDPWLMIISISGSSRSSRIGQTRRVQPSSCWCRYRFWKKLLIWLNRNICLNERIRTAAKIIQ